MLCDTGGHRHTFASAVLPWRASIRGVDSTARFGGEEIANDPTALGPLQLENRDLPSWNRVREDPGAKLFNFTVHRLSLVTG
jgi:hypothetical protein